MDAFRVARRLHEAEVVHGVVHVAAAFLVAAHVVVPEAVPSAPVVEAVPFAEAARAVAVGVEHVALARAVAPVYAAVRVAAPVYWVAC
jgi:hypothetical protein